MKKAETQLNKARADQLARSLKNKDAQIEEVRQALEVQKVRAANADAALLEIKDQIRGRFITNDQRRDLVNRLVENSKGKIRVTCIGGGNPEPCSFARHLVGVLGWAGWNVEFNENFQFTGSVPVGLQIQVLNPERPPTRAVALLDALRTIDRKVTIQRSYVEETDQDISLLVGSKPPIWAV